MPEIGERMATAEQQLRSLQEQQIRHEKDCLEYRRSVSTQLDKISLKQESMSLTLAKWGGAVIVIIPVVNAIFAVVAKQLGLM